MDIKVELRFLFEDVALVKIAAWKGLNKINEIELPIRGSNKDILDKTYNECLSIADGPKRIYTSNQELFNYIHSNKDRNEYITVIASGDVKVMTKGKLKTKVEFDFTPIYNLYPRKEGKHQGFKHLAKLIKSEEDYKILAIGVKSFAEKVKRDKVETKFIPLFSTFCNQNRWLDYINEEPIKGLKVVT